MAKSKSGYCAAIDKLPWILRLIFALPVLDGIIYVFIVFARAWQAEAY